MNLRVTYEEKSSVKSALATHGGGEARATGVFFKAGKMAFGDDDARAGHLLGVFGEVAVVHGPGKISGPVTLKSGASP